MKGKQRLLRGNFRCVSNNEGRKQKAVQNQWNSSCEFLNTNLLYPPQKALKNLIHRMCYRKTLYKACQDCFCREKLIQKGKFFLSCSVLKTKSYSEKQQNKKISSMLLCCSMSLQAGMFDSDCWRKLFQNSEQTLLVLERLDTGIFFAPVLYS